MFGNVTALEGLHVTGKHRDKSMTHTYSRHAAWDPHTCCIWWTGLAPWDFESDFPGSLISTFLVPDAPVAARPGAAAAALALRQEPGLGLRV